MVDPFRTLKEQPRRSRATNLEIQKWIARRHGFVPQTAWIEHCRHLQSAPANGLAADPCPPEYQPAIRQAFARFGMFYLTERPGNMSAFHGSGDGR
jgi:hypothetical protein